MFEEGESKMAKVKKKTKEDQKPEPLAFGLPRVMVHQEVASTTELRTLATQEKERLNWAESLLGIPRVWTRTRGEGIKVAVLDTGIDLDHEDLKEAIVGSKDFTGDGVEDKNGHGTHCAGIIAARRNRVGFVGVAPKADLLIGKVLGNQGNGSFSWIAAGVDWAVRRGAHIISMSLGGPSSSQVLFQAVHNALAKGVLIVCAAGNEGSLFQNSIGYPGRYGGVITVAAHDNNGNRSGFSSRGGEIDVMAPGSNIWSTYKNGGYAELSGTSMATPFVAGLAALILSKHLKARRNNTPVQNNEDLKNHLLWMAAHPGFHDNETGYGPLQPFQYFE
jgi:subtilisin family serine protease